MDENTVVVKILRDKRPGYIYLIALGNGLYKIGRSNNPKRRLAEFRVINPKAKIIITGKVGHDTRTEKELHLKYFDKRVAGEIYRLKAKDIQWIKDQILIVSKDYQRRSEQNK